MKKTIAIGCLSFLLFSCTNSGSTEKTASADSAVVATAQEQPAEFADPKYAAIGKSNLDNLSSGNVDAYMSSFADNAVYLWNNGDSLAGKAAISAYWKKRRSEVIDSMSFSNEIWLPIKVNKPQSVEQSGIWLLSWYQVSSKYKNGNRMGQWIHADLHFDASDKIDRFIIYLDHAPINVALKK